MPAAASIRPSTKAQVEDIPADSVIFAIGQTSDLSFLDPADGVESERGLIKVNRETYQTTAPDVFACGDIAHGARLFIDAIASAQIAARSMHDFLRGTRTDVTVRKQWSPADVHDGRRLEHARARESAGAGERPTRAASLEIVEMDYARRRRGGRRRAACAATSIRYSTRQVRGVQRLRGRLPGESDPPGGPEQLVRTRSGCAKASAMSFEGENSTRWRGA